MVTEVIMLATLLGRPTFLIDAVWKAGGLDAVALVECESHFNPRALRHEPRGYTSWGLYQIDNEFHPQWRNDILMHIVEGQSFLNSCKKQTRELRYVVALYNGSLTWGKIVERKRDSFALYLWRHLR
jgi:hypothetical protein